MVDPSCNRSARSRAVPALQQVGLVAQLDLEPLGRVEQHPVVHLDRAHRRTDRHHLRPGQPASHLHGGGDQDAARAAPLRASSSGRQDTVVQHRIGGAIGITRGPVSVWSERCPARSPRRRPRGSLADPADRCGRQSGCGNTTANHDQGDGADVVNALRPRRRSSRRCRPRCRRPSAVSATVCFASSTRFLIAVGYLGAGPR